MIAGLLGAALACSTTESSRIMREKAKVHHKIDTNKPSGGNSQKGKVTIQPSKKTTLTHSAFQTLTTKAYSPCNDTSAYRWRDKWATTRGMTKTAATANPRMPEAGSNTRIAVTVSNQVLTESNENKPIDTNH